MVDEEGTAGRKGCWMRKEQQEGKVVGGGRSSKKGRLVDEEETVGREGWWMKKEQQEGKWWIMKEQQVGKVGA
jgi:hypothetical protein